MSIITFEEITPDLNEKQIETARFIGRALSKYYRGKANAVTNGKIRKGLEAQGFGRIAPATIRKMINWAITSGEFPGIVACSKGYFLAVTEKEKRDYIQSLEQRVNEISRRRDVAQRYFFGS